VYYRVRPYTANRRRADELAAPTLDDAPGWSQPVSVGRTQRSDGLLAPGAFL